MTQARFQVLDRPVSANQRGSSTNAPFTTPGPAQVAALERRVLRPAPGLPECLALGLEQVGRVAVLPASCGTRDAVGRRLGLGHHNPRARRRGRGRRFTINVAFIRGLLRVADRLRRPRLRRCAFRRGCRPSDADLVAGLRALDGELQERVLRDRRAPLRTQHGLPLSDGDLLDEPGRESSCQPRPCAGRSPSVAHQHAHGRPCRLPCARMRIGSAMSLLLVGLGGSAAAAAEGDLDFLLREQHLPSPIIATANDVGRLAHLHGC